LPGEALEDGLRSPCKGLHRCLDPQPVDPVRAAGDPARHADAITIRPLPLYGVGCQIRNANRITITIARTQGKVGCDRRSWPGS
jgi:hypothetical protein